MGYELDGLKNLLTKAGKWQEPPPKRAEAEPRPPLPMRPNPPRQQTPAAQE